MAKALVFLAEGFEEVEAVTPIDYLRRAGVEVTAVSVTARAAVRGAHGVILEADAVLFPLSAAEWDAVILPGGQPGASNLAASPEVGKFLLEMNAAGKIVAAICAAPAVVLAPLGLLSGRVFTCYTGMEKALKTPDARWVDENVAADGNLVTSRGPGTAGDFALTLVTRLAGGGEAKKLAEAALL